MPGGRKPGRCGSSGEQGLHSAQNSGSDAGCTAGLASGNRRSAAAKSKGLAGKRTGGSSVGNHGGAAGSEKSSEGQSPGVWEAERGLQGQRGLRRRGGSQTPGAGLLEGMARPFRRRAVAGRQKGLLRPIMLKGDGSRRGAAQRGWGFPAFACGNGLRGKPLRWRVSAREGLQGVRRLAPRDPGFEDPKGRENLRPEGEDASHESS